MLVTGRVAEGRATGLHFPIHTESQSMLHLKTWSLAVVACLLLASPAAGQEDPAESPPEKAGSIVINVDQHGRILVAGKAVSLEQLGAILKEKAGQSDQDVEVAIRADRRCQYQHVIGVLNACKVVRVQNVTINADATSEAEAVENPNVLLILVDDLGYGDLSAYGATDLATPHIDRLIGQGMRLDRFYANCPVCSPTRAALLSGRYQEAVGVPGVVRTRCRDSWGFLTSDAVLLPAVMKPAGYRTAMFGKWHLGLGEPNLPNGHGFEHFEGYLGDMMDDYYKHRRHGINYMDRNGEEIDPPGHATDLFTDWTCRWLEGYTDEKPFFIYLAYNAPHSPIQPPADWLARYREKHPDVPLKRAKLAALIEHMDAGIGRVLAALEKSGRAGNTLVVFTSDNGGALHYGANNGPTRNGKGTTYEGGLRVPMCARWPGKIAPGSRSDIVALTMDLFPTITQAAGLSKPQNLDGVSILPILIGKAETLPPRDVVFSRLMPPGRIYALRRGRYKVLTPAAGKPLAMYDLETDPLETTDLSKDRPELFAQLRDALDAHIARFAEVPYRPKGGIAPGEIGPGREDK